jgi:hypothetical protein
MTTELDTATREQLWIDPDWLCPRCQTTNLAIRESCRECGYIGGEFQVIEATWIIPSSIE